MANKSSDAFQGANAPAVSAVAVTPSDVGALTKMSRGLWVGGAGNLAVTMADGNNITFVGVAAGTWMELQVQQVLATGTTATNIIAIY